MKDLGDIVETLAENDKAMEEMEKPWAQKLQEEQERENQVMNTAASEDKRVPHLTNLNEDPQLTGKVFYSLIDCPVYVGRRSGIPPPQIILGAVGIR